MAAKKNQWSDEQLKAAIEDIQTNGLSLRKTAIKYSIPRSTLSDHLTGKSTKHYRGAPTILSPEEHEIFVMLKEKYQLIIKHFCY